MSTVLEDLKALLTAALAPAGLVWYGANTAEPPVYPYIVVTRVSSTPNVTLSGPSDLQNTRVQIDIFSQQISLGVAIESALEAAMAAWSVGNVPLSSADVYEDQVRAFRITKDFSIWSTN